MQDFKFDGNDDLIVTPSPTSSQHDFDFYAGKWKIRNRKLKSRLSNSDECTKFVPYVVLRTLGRELLG